MGPWKRPPLDQLAPKNIALIKPSALGDIIHTLPILTALRRRFAQARITWIVNSGYRGLLEGHPHLDDIIAFERGAVRGGYLRALASYGKFLLDLRRRKFDLVIDLQGLLRSGIMAMATGAPRRVGLTAAREGASCFYTDVVPGTDRLTLHAVDRYWRVAEALGAGQGPIEFHVPIPDLARQWAEEQLLSWPRPWLMVAAGSRWQTKRWLPRHFAALAGRAQERFGGTIVLVGGGDEIELACQVGELLRGPRLDLTGKTTLPQLSAVLARADLMIANDTGPLHVATALGRHIVAPYTCTRIPLTGPYGVPGAVQTTVWCQGSLLKKCRRLECMEQLTPDRLWPLVQEVLQQKWPSSSQSA